VTGTVPDVGFQADPDHFGSARFGMIATGCGYTEDTACAPVALSELPRMLHARRFSMTSNRAANTY
jgi:hypothetical protein